LEILAGVVLGPSVLGWVEVDLPVQILALIGLAFLLLRSGLEIDFPGCGVSCCASPSWTTWCRW